MKFDHIKQISTGFLLFSLFLFVRQKINKSLYTTLIKLSLSRSPLSLSISVFHFHFHFLFLSPSLSSMSDWKISGHTQISRTLSGYENSATHADESLSRIANYQSSYHKKIARTGHSEVKKMETSYISKLLKRGRNILELTLTSKTDLLSFVLQCLLPKTSSV